MIYYITEVRYNQPNITKKEYELNHIIAKGKSQEAVLRFVSSQTIVTFNPDNLIGKRVENIRYEIYNDKDILKKNYLVALHPMVRTAVANIDGEDYYLNSFDITKYSILKKVSLTTRKELSIDNISAEITFITPEHQVKVIKTPPLEPNDIDILSVAAHSPFAYLHRESSYLLINGRQKINVETKVISSREEKYYEED